MRRSGATAAASIERFLGIARLVLVAGGAVAAAVCGWWDAPTLALTAVALVWGGARLFGLGRNPPRAAVAIFALAWIVSIAIYKLGRLEDLELNPEL